MLGSDRVVRFDDAGGTRVQRYDRGFLRDPRRTAEGYLIADGLIAKPGVLQYIRGDGTLRRELVLPEVLHDPASLDTLKRKPITLEHPDDLIGPENVQQVQVGDVGAEIRIDSDGRVVVPMAVRADRALAAIDRGVRALSPGYECRLEDTSGNHPKYGEYDFIQRDRRYNHLAITDLGRGGVDLRVRADAAYAVRDMLEGAQTGGPDGDAPKTDVQPKEREDAMNPLIAALIALGLSEDAAKAAEPDLKAKVNAQMRHDAATAQETVTTVTKERDDAIAERDALKVRVDSLGLDPAKDDQWTDAARQARFMAAHTVRSSLEVQATALKLDSAEVAKMDDPALRRAILGKGKPDLKLDDKSEDFITAAVEMLHTDSAPADPWQPTAANPSPPVKRADGSPADTKPVTRHPALSAYDKAHNERFSASN